MINFAWLFQSSAKSIRCWQSFSNHRNKFWYWSTSGFTRPYGFHIMEFFLLVSRAPVHDARSGAFQLHPISYSPVEVFISTDVQNSQICASLHKTWIRKANSYHHYMLWSLALGHHWQHYFPIFPFTSQPLLTYSSASGCLWIARRYIFWKVFKYFPPHLTASPHILISYRGYFWISRVTDQRSLVKQPLFTYSSASGYLWILCTWVLKGS